MQIVFRKINNQNIVFSTVMNIIFSFDQSCFEWRFIQNTPKAFKKTNYAANVNFVIYIWS